MVVTLVRVAAGNQNVNGKEMKLKKIRIIGVAIVLLSLFASTLCFAAESPKEVVTRFCELDFEGHRLSSNTYTQIAPLIMYPEEPGWDRVLGIHEYEITSETIEGKTAKVTVRYEIAGVWPQNIEIKNEYRNDTFNLNQENGAWKISEYIPYPRVSSSLLCTKYKLCSPDS